MIDQIKGKIQWVRSTDFLAVLTLLFTSILFFYDLLGERYLLTERDLISYFIPPRFFWVESLKRGDFPLWNPYQFSGHPFFANPQHAILYPINILFFLFPFDLAFNTIIILHFFLGGLFTYLFLRDLKVSLTGSIISGLIFMLGGYLLSVHSLLTILLSVIWTPLIMMFFRKAIDNPGFKNEILTALFITISFFGGGVEIVYGNFIVLLCVVFLPLVPINGRQGESEWRRIWRGIRSLLIISIIFFILSGVQLLPFLELLRHSIRGTGISYQEATTWSFAPHDFLLFFLPDFFGYFLDMKKYWVTQCWLKTLYTGGMPFILCLIYFLFLHPPLPFIRERDGIRGFGRGRVLFLSLILLSLFLSLGHNNPLYPLVFKYLPFFNGIRYPVKFLYIFIFVLAITAGLGFERLRAFTKEDGGRGLKHLFIALSLLSGFLLLFFILGHQGMIHFLKEKGIDFPDFNHLSTNLYHIKRFFFYLTLFFLLLRVGYEMKWRGWTRVLLVFFLITDLFGNMGFYGKEKTSDYFQKTKILEMVSSDQGHFRIFSTPKTISMETPVLIAEPNSLNLLKEKHLPSLNLIYKLYDIWGIDVVRLKRVDDLYKAFTSSPSISATNLVNLYGVKYVISITPLEESSRFKLVYARIEGLQGVEGDLLKENTIKLYRNLRPLERAWLVKDFMVMDSKMILSTITRQDFDPKREVLLESEPKLERKMGGHGGPPLQNINRVGGPLCGHQYKVDLISESNNRLSLQVEAVENSILVLSDTYYPGWKVFVDGKEERILRANYNFRAVALSAGMHQVKFIYDPLSFKLGAGLTLLGVMGCIIIGLAIRYKKSHHKKSFPSQMV